ncbi:MAG: hypothetical protein EB090_05080 [Verrucomicrobia bacterium]|nr:hypothetical protein [Verrucomicrobiota bacterium]
MKTIQSLIIEALKNSGHTVALVDRELKIRWTAGVQRSLVGSPVEELWKGLSHSRREMGGVMRNLSCGNGCSTEFRLRDRTKRNHCSACRIDFIPLRDASGEVEGFAAVRQMAKTAAAHFSGGVAEVYELLFEMNSDEFSGLLAV